MTLPAGPRMPRRRALVVIGSSVAAIGSAPFVLAACEPPVPVDTTFELDPESLPVDVPTLVGFEFEKPDGSIGQGSAWFLRQEGEDLVAYDPRCTHQACEYAWEPAQANFACVCHEAAFDIDGEVLFGPPPRPLARFPLVLSGTSVTLTVPSNLQAPKTED